MFPDIVQLFFGQGLNVSNSWRRIITLSTCTHANLPSVLVLVIIIGKTHKIGNVTARKYINIK